MPLTRGQTQDPNKVMFFEHKGSQAARIGDWKIVRSRKQAWELYNLSVDPTELENLINEHPEKAETLTARFNQWAEECGVRPWPVKAEN